MTTCPECNGTGARDSGGTHPWGEPIYLPCGCKDAEIGRQWREDSSLEKWFPVTAERLAALKSENATLAMMLRKCAHRLKCNGHEDLSADVVALLRRYGLLGSPLRGTETEHG